MRLLHAAPLAAVLAVALAAPPAGAAAPDRGAGRAGQPSAYAKHAPRPGVTDEDFYFVMGDRFDNGDTTNDQGGMTGDRDVTGFDPTAKGFYNGGDLDGLRSRLDYIQGLGTDAIWLTPIFKNKPVQLEDGPSAGYHGYWITDFTTVDPHLGTNDDLAALVAAAHDRGMKVYFDIITNHTADVIGYDEGDRTAYVSKDAVPYRDAAGDPFDDRDFAGTSQFPALDPATSFPYTPKLAPGEEDLKVPAWLNDMTNYHNRGNTTFTGEDSQYGDFFGLDDLFTEKPAVVNGMIDIYRTWVEDFDIDGFRIDTMKHVNDEFWQKFGPTMQRIAAADGNPGFFMFGEVALDGSDAGTKAFTSHYTTHDRMQAVLDFPFQDAARGFASKGLGTDRLATFFRNDDWYTDRDSNAYELPTFLGNHDMGRIGHFLKADNPEADDAELLSRDLLAHELMYFSRGNPVVYYGDEQGFTGAGGDQLARQSMFASQVPEYRADDQIGTDRTGADDNFVTDSPIYQAIHRLATITDRHPALRDGAEQVRYSTSGPGIFAFSRIDRQRRTEYVVALNNGEQQQTAAVPTYLRHGSFQKVYGDGPAQLTSDAHRRLDLTVPALSTSVYRSTDRIPRPSAAPGITLAAPAAARVANGRMHVAAKVTGSSFNEVTFQQRVGHGPWRTVGVDDNAPYQVFPDVSVLAAGTKVSYRAAVMDLAGHTRGSRARTATVPRTAIEVVAPAGGGTVSSIGPVTVTATADPERPLQSVEFERSVGTGPWTSLGTDSSAPAYTITDDVSDLPLGTQVRYRATLSEHGVAQRTSAPVTVTTAEPKPAVRSVTVAGSLQSELGCPGDWQPDCAATHLAFDPSDGRWHGTFTLPGGDYEWKVAIDDSWDVNYGAGGAAGGGNLALSVPTGGGTYVFTWDQVTHVPSVAPAG
ncbi:alpha-amylase family glycosyl hydrolase [Nocardioides sp. T2.26MG-1]|uniref:alpha-amylase family glycosyl hydrolase n=1 Tax=Nocardioides sp. T2.26MG-1 TaxID=3041166 RepID=UPI0024774103|nr:alpha-amylase family glycosyl hydrolase [Nocardioides sp. T2.26MG-1]CAI9401863.1 Alpha-1,4-glucan:maltose-1-phosphate maltosyltransferase [Nocardioides sp. T2.26MG-1]